MTSISSKLLTIATACGLELDLIASEHNLPARENGQTDHAYRMMILSYFDAVTLGKKFSRVMGGNLMLCQVMGGDWSWMERGHFIVVRSAGLDHQQMEAVRYGNASTQDSFRVFPVKSEWLYAHSVLNCEEERLGEVVDEEEVNPSVFTPVEPNDDELMSVDDMLGHYEVLRLRAEEANQAAAVANAELNGALLKLEELFEASGWNISRIQGGVK